jgi:hypothetical protein
MSAPDAVAAAVGQQLTVNGAAMLFYSPRIPLILQIESIQRCAIFSVDVLIIVEHVTRLFEFVQISRPPSW